MRIITTILEHDSTTIEIADGAQEDMSETHIRIRVPSSTSLDDSVALAQWKALKVAQEIISTHLQHNKAIIDGR